MERGPSGGWTEMLQEREKAMALLRCIDQRLEEIGQRQEDLLCDIAEAEERGDWRLAAHLKRSRLVERKRMGQLARSI